MGSLAPSRLRVYAENSITVSTTAVRLTAAQVYANPLPEEITIFVTGAQIRFRSDGTAPTSSVGELLNPFDRYTITNRNEMADFQAIRAGSTDATLRVRYKTGG